MLHVLLLLLYVSVASICQLCILTYNVQLCVPIAALLIYENDMNVTQRYREGTQVS